MDKPTRSVIALDQGTTGSTALVLAQNGDVLGRGYREFKQYYPEPGLVEHDAEEIFRVTIESAKEAIDRAGLMPEAVGITNQRETVVVWDRNTGKPAHPAIVWQDRRTTDRCEVLNKEFGPAYISDRTGLVWDPYFSGTKFEWLLESVQGIRNSAESGNLCFGTIDSWLVYCLTKGRSWITDHTNASRTLLYNIDGHQWDPELLDLFGIPEVCLPEIRSSSEVVGVADTEYFGTEIPIAGIAGDQQAALFGQTCWQPGQAKCTYGTGAFLLENIGTDRGKTGGKGVLTTVACDASGEPAYALEGAILVAGAAIQWLRDELGIIANASETEDLAASLSNNGGVYFVPAFVGLGSPEWEARARGTIVGITRGTSKAHLARAALESMAYSTKDVVDAMTESSGVRLEELRVDGGASSNDWLMQFQADVLGVSVARPRLVESTAVGAAGLAGLAIGIWESSEEFGRSMDYQWFKPGASSENSLVGWRRAKKTAVEWARG